MKASSSTNESGSSLSSVISHSACTLVTKTFSYTAKRKYLNSGFVRPLPTKKFSLQEIKEIEVLLGEDGGVSSIKSSETGIYVLFETSLRFDNEIYNRIPQSLTKAQIKEIELATKIKNREAESKRDFNETISRNDQVVNWIDDIFGQNFTGNFNKKSLIKFLAGEIDVPDVLVSHKWVDGLNKANAIKDGQPDWEALKLAYKNSTSPI